MQILIPAKRALVLVAGSVALTGAAQVQQMLSEPADGSAANSIHGFRLYNSGFFWASGGNTCGGEFASFTRIGLEGYAAYPPLPAHYVMVDCQAMPADVVRDGQYVYYADNKDGRLYKKSVAAQPSDPPIEIPTSYTPLGSGWQFGGMTLWNGRLYWTDNNPSYGFRVNSINPDGTGFQNDLTGGYLGGNHVSKLVGFTYEPSFLTFVDALFILTDDGTLFRQDINPRAYDLVTVDTGVLDFALRNESIFSGRFISFFTTLYAAKGLKFGSCATYPSGSLVSMAAGTSSGIGESVLFQANNQFQITSVAVDGQYLFFTEQGIAGFGGNCGIWPTPANIYRQTRPSTNPGSSTTWDLIVSSGFNQAAGPNLCSDGQELYFMTGNQINRIWTGAPAIGFDLQADALEVVQASQDLNISVPLVANRPTFARGYAHLAQNTSSKSSFYPAAVLHGYLNGVEFPNSPIFSSGLASITSQASLDILRGQPASSFLFELPPDWVQPGSLQLTMTVNPDQSIPETGANPLGNNSVSLAQAASITRKGRAALVLVPMRTDWPAFDPTASYSGLNTILARTRSLLPVEDFNIYYETEQVEKPVVNVCFCLPPVQINMEPFKFPDDQNWALIWMAVRNALSSNPSGQNDVHYVGTVPRLVSNFNGIGGARGVKLSDLADWLPPIPIPSTPFDSTTVVRFESGPGARIFDSPMGGVTLAHELSHNYGRFHIDQTTSALGCGNSKPAAPYQNDYPYDHCLMGSTTEPSALFGFDPITHTAIPPQTADLMSYAPVTWISDFNWEAIVGQVPTAQASPLYAVHSNGATPDTPQVLLVRGLIGPTANQASFHTFYLMNTNDVDFSKMMSDLRAASDMAPGYPYAMVFSDAGGTPLGTNNVLLFPGERDEVPEIPFVQFMPFNPLTRLVQLTYGGTVVTQRVVSPNPPVVSITSLNVDGTSQNISLGWKASDPDGDVLFFTVQYSADNGASWNTLKLDYIWQSITISSKMLHGSTAARLRVVASDGFNTATATTDSFVIPNHPPVVTIQGLVPGQRVPYGSTISLAGLALDAEDGSIPGSNLVWTAAGPTPRSAAGPQFSLMDLSPGSYTVSLAGTDSDGMVGTAQLSFQLLPLVVPDSGTPAFDGTGSDPAYGNAVQVRVPLGNSGFAYARLIHSTNDNSLYAAFTGMKFSSDPSALNRIGLRADPDFSQSATPQSNDAGFYVGEDGLQLQLVGNGTAMANNLSPLPGFNALIARGSAGWSAEFRIAATLLGGWNHAAGLMFGQESTAAGGGSYPWPVTADGNQPGSWAPAYLGALPALPNLAPVALTGPDQVVDLAQPRTIYLDGSPSYDPDGEPLTYAWVQLSGPAVTISNAASAAATFVAAPVETGQVLSFQLTVSDGALASSATTRVTLAPTTRARMTFQTWRTAYFSPAQLSVPAISGMTADPDNDGTVNLLEYAFDMNPLVADANMALSQGGGRPVFGETTVNDGSGQTTYPTISFVRWKGPVDLSYSVQSSLDLVNWTDQAASPGSFVEVGRTDTGTGGQLEIVTVRPTVPMSGPSAAAHQFLRVAVTPSP